MGEQQRQRFWLSAGDRKGGDYGAAKLVERDNGIQSTSDIYGDSNGQFAR